MERLTKRCGEAALIADSIDGSHDACEVIDILAARLAAYEDTGLSPEEVEGVKARVKAYDEILGGVDEPRAKAIYELLDGINRAMELLEGATS